MANAQRKASYRALSDQVFKALKKDKLSGIDRLFDSTGMGAYAKRMNLMLLNSYNSDRGHARQQLNYWEDAEGCKVKTAQLLRFKSEQRMVYLTFGCNGLIQSVSFGQPTDQPFFQLRGYLGRPEVTDLSATVKTRDGLTLGASIAFSDTSRKLPLVIFVHGSGPNDRDETLGPNKVFRDLAQGLAQKNVASLRYDKRTFAYQFDLRPPADSLTLYEETINDAVDAIREARQFTFIDTNRIYLVGHSQGAMCAPEIARLSPKLKAVVMMAGPVRSLLDLIPEQIEYVSKLDDTISNAEQMQMTSIKWMVDKIRSPKLDPKTPSSMLMGGSPVYWKSILKYNQAETAKQLHLPILILNGERDYQVTMKEFELWKQALGDYSNVQFKSYPKLNHLFIEGEGKPNPAEYDTPNHVPQYVVDDLVNFILNH